MLPYVFIFFYAGSRGPISTGLGGSSLSGFSTNTSRLSGSARVEHPLSPAQADVDVLGSDTILARLSGRCFTCGLGGSAYVELADSFSPENLAVAGVDYAMARLGGKCFNQASTEGIACRL